MRDRVYYTVAGQTPFPVDMLRYDNSLPQREQDSNLITESIIDESKSLHFREIHLAHCAAGIDWRPTRNRWRSFGWDVICVGDSPEREV